MVCALLACSAGRPAAQHEPAPAPAPLHVGPLTDYVPAAGLEWLVVVDLAELADDPWLRPALDRHLTAERRAAFARAYGIDVLGASSAVVAGYTFGTLYLVRASGDELQAEEAFLARAGGAASEERPHQRIRILTGVLDEQPVRLTSVRGSFVAIGTGDPMLARIVALYALEQLDASPAALHGAAFGAIPAAFHSAPLRLYVSGPIGVEGVDDEHSLARAATAFALAAHPKGRSLEVRMLLGGSWDALEDLPRAEATWERLAASAIGRLTALDDPVAGPVIELDDGWLEASVVLRTERLLDGLRAAVDAELRELFGPSVAADVQTNDPPAD